MSFERRKVRVGRVVSDKMDKSIVVIVEWRQPYALYRKSVRRRTKFTAHDSENQYKVGDLVRILEGRPLSKTKRWRVVELLHREEIAEVQPDEIIVGELAELESAPVAEVETAVVEEDATEEIVAEAETAEEEPEVIDEEQPTPGESDEDEGEKEADER